MREVAEIKEDVKLHLRETEVLQKQWITYVFEAVEKLHSRVEENTLQVQKEREEFFRELVSLKDKLSEKISEVSKEQAVELKTLEEKLVEFIDYARNKFTDISTRVGVSIDEADERQTKDISNLEKSLRDELLVIVSNQNKENTKLSTELGALTTAQAVISTKVAVYVALVSLGTTTVIGVLATSLLFVFRDAFKAWLG